MFAILLIPAALLIGYGYYYLFRFSSAISEKFVRQPAAVGFIILSALTSLPEIASVVYSLQKNYTTVPVAAVSGSNVFNFTFLLALILWRNTLKISGISREEDLWAQVFVAFIVFLNFIYSSSIHPVTLFVLLMIFIIYGFLVRKSFLRNQKEKVFFNSFSRKQKSVYSLMMGVLLTIVGCIFLVESSLSVSTNFNLNEFAVSTFLVGSFTSIPELLLFFYLIRKNHSSIAVSVLTGSGVFNWVVALIIPLFIYQTVIDGVVNVRCQFGAYFFAIISVYFYLLYRKKQPINRHESIVLTIIYLLYLIWGFLC